MKNCMKMALVAGCAMSAVAMADKPQLSNNGNGIKVDPVRYAAVKSVNGKLQMVGGWQSYNTFGGRSGETCLFDDFGRAWGPGSTGTPVGGDTMPCSVANGLGASSRWYFGGTYYNPYMVDDMTVWSSGTIDSIGAGWWWLNDPALSTRCLLAFLLSEDTMDGTCTTSPDGNIISSGIILDFGTLAGTNAGYYYTDSTGLSSLAQAMPATQDGAASYALIIAEDFDDTTGVLTLSAGPCQFMLWGAGAIRNDGLNACGDQTSVGYDDDNPTDATLDAPGECYDSAFGICPDPLGKAVAFGAVGCQVDFNGDGFVTGDDFDGFVAAFELGDPSADFNGDGFVTGDDFDAFVALFELGC